MSEYKTKTVGNATITYIQPAYPTAFMQLTKLQFVRLLQEYGGMTIEQTIAASEDVNLKYFWVLVEMTGGFDYEDPSLGPGLDLLYALGYIPNGKQAVLDNWPTL